MELYHGSGETVEFPEIRKTHYTKDFSWGFYCTNNFEQAYRWAERKHTEGVVNIYEYTENKELNIKKFHEMTDEWLDFIADCRIGIEQNRCAMACQGCDAVFLFLNKKAVETKS